MLTGIISQNIKRLMKLLYIILLTWLVSCSAKTQDLQTISSDTMKLRTLTEFESYVIRDKGTERPFTGAYTDMFDEGVYACKQCGTHLYTSNHKFHSGCGWPAFDDEIPGAVTRIPDADGSRIEIICSTCKGHLGHVFTGEGFTQKDVRHCVNSVSLEFIPTTEKLYDTAYFANGCFWGTQYWFNKTEGVIKTTVGYSGGNIENPTYEQVCSGNTGHAECIEVIYDTSKTDFKTLAKLFFNTHDPTQINRQGPDIGEQYRSEIFYTSAKQKQIADELFVELYKKGIDVATEITPFAKFYPAEEYHQQYYEKKQGIPYCHVFREKF